MATGAPPRPPRVERIGDTVRRPVGPGGARVHELLLALEDIGFAHSPRFLGIDDEGREVLSWIEGESGSAGWAKVVPEDGLRRFARSCARSTPPPPTSGCPPTAGPAAGATRSRTG